MKALKIIGLIVGIIIVLVILAGIILPKQITVEREIVLNASIEEVYPQVVHFENFVKWSPWSEIDPNSVESFEGVDGEVGAKFLWKGNDEVGEGFMEIVAIEPKQKVEMDLVFTAPWEDESKIFYYFEGDTVQTKFKWTFENSYPIPQNIIMAAMGMEKMLGESYDKGLANLKEMIEN